jgi:hypothetical protein
VFAEPWWAASVVFEKFTGDGIKFIDVRAVEIVDLRYSIAGPAC